MASTTTNIGLTKPAGTDQALISAINGNMDIIDTKMGAVGNTSVQSQITSLSDQIATYLHVEELTYDSTNGYFPVTGIPRDGMQICVPARNISTGAIYILWYSHTQRAFRVGATVSGNAPANGEKVAVQFIQ